MSSGLTGTYSTTLIHDMGFKNRQSALLNMPTGVVGIITNLTVGFGIRRTSNRWAWAVGLTFRELCSNKDSVTSLTASSWHSWCITFIILASAKSSGLVNRIIFGCMHLLNNHGSTAVGNGQCIRSYKKIFHGSRYVCLPWNR